MSADGNQQRSWWDRRVLPWLVEKACRSSVILAERQRWVPRARGVVLEVGVGSGLNLAFYDANRVTGVTGIDPSEELLLQAKHRAVEATAPVTLERGDATALRFDAGAFDTILVTYTLCSVPDVSRALREMKRVLKPSGALILVEHGLAARRHVQLGQHALTPLWRRIGGGCHLNRDIATEVRRAGFAFDELEAAPSAGGVPFTAFTYQGLAHPT
jgi:SAM-dependent methyltransferase